jgi:UDP-N-acetylmuramoyl-tripeptide--D-alanyl-D-alanine ligase
MSRPYALLLSVVVLGAVAFPLKETVKAPEDRVDSFPLSYYPAASGVAPDVVGLDHCVGVEMSGRRIRIPYTYWGAATLTQGREQMARLVAQGEAHALCRRIARRVSQGNDPAFANVAQVQILHSVYKPLDYFRGDKDPISLRVLAKASLDRPFSVSREAYAPWLEEHVADLGWDGDEWYPRVTRPMLHDTLKRVHGYLLANQRPLGNFHARYDFVKRSAGRDDPVAQAYATWALAMLHRNRDDDKAKGALDKALRFFVDRTEQGPADGTLVFRYPGANTCDTQAVALVGLAIIEYLLTEKDELEATFRQQLGQTLKGFISHLERMRLESGRFASSWSLQKSASHEDATPAADGAALLCLTRAARHLGFERLVPQIQAHSLSLAHHYTVGEWGTDPDSEATRDFFPWSSQAFREYLEAGWDDRGPIRDYLEATSWWMVRTHRVIDRERNTAYALEGLVSVYALTKGRSGHENISAELFATIDKLLFRLTSWQVEGPLVSESNFLLTHRTKDPRASGGILAAEEDPMLRVDVATRHAHAVILALKDVYPEDTE